MDALVERNALAEDEARHLSTFNAEILGHHNPAQRIMYVDRIRQELHDVKLVSPNDPCLRIHARTPLLLDRHTTHSGLAIRAVR